MYPLGPATPSLLRAEPLIDGRAAPARTLFVLGADGGYAAAPARSNRLVLGRNSNDVHVTVGAMDWYISREHATIRFAGDAARPHWLLRNDGRLPIRIPDMPGLLHGHEVELPLGYTPLYIRGSRRHVVEVLISRTGSPPASVRPDTGTRDMRWPLAQRERLVLVALLQEFLLRTDDPRPLSWKETSEVLNDVPGQGGWTERKAENVVDGLRHKLARAGKAAVTVDSAHPEVIKLNLARFLVETATLVPPDLGLLETDADVRGRGAGVV
jgi:hypothetical protein